jgi:phenylpropionate dioxygenase-like ring-hydroxylating dioxygenase large terminal subunit
MYINFWYCAATSDDVSADKPFQVRMLGQDFVLFRDSDGQAHCLHDVCVHRGASLAHGKIKDDCVECPYHGWQYDGTGTCKRIPSLDPGQKIPPRAKVDSYPTQEKYGMIFAFLGDLPEEERPWLLEIKEWGQEGWSASLQKVDDIGMNYKRAVENGMDSTHNDFVHPELHIPDDAKGNRPVILQDYRETDFPDWITEYIAPLPMKQFDADTFELDESRTGFGTVVMGASGLCSLYTYINPEPGFNIHQYFWETPIDEAHTRVHLLTMRTFMLTDKGTEKTIAQNRFVVDQDLGILKRIRPAVPPAKNVTEVLVPSDKPIARYRKLLQTWQDYGWRIDVKAIRSSEADNVVYAIPSPGRRTAKNWAIPSVPLQPALDQDKASVA